MALARGGRKSAAELEVVQIGTARPRPEPPLDLTEEQAEVWRSIVDRLPPDWFATENQPLLAQYCRHTVSARRLGEVLAIVERSSERNIYEYDRLLAMQERESRAMSSLATRMRLTQHSVYDKTKKRQAVADTPWTEPVAKRA